MTDSAIMEEPFALLKDLQESYRIYFQNTLILNMFVSVCTSKSQVKVALQIGRKGTLDCKLHWYPKFYIRVGSKTLGTFTIFRLVNSKQAVSKVSTDIMNLRLNMYPI